MNDEMIVRLAGMEIGTVKKYGHRWAWNVTIGHDWTPSGQVRVVQGDDCDCEDEAARELTLAVLRSMVRDLDGACPGESDSGDGSFDTKIDYHPRAGYPHSWKATAAYAKQTAGEK